MKTALITGITGQDGAYLTQYLLKMGYKVFGGYRRVSTPNFWRLDYLGIKESETFKLIPFDLLDMSNCVRVISETEPDEVYNLAAQSFVGVSFDQPYNTSLASGLGTLNLLEAIRILNKSIKFYQASTSEMFGKVREVPQTETTGFYPRSPYAVAKLYAHWTTVNYREAYGIFASSGILFNHESPLRGIEFVTRKITDGVARISLGLLEHIELGNIDASRDWGFAGDFVEGMHAMLQHENPDTFVLATNSTHTIREFVEMTFAQVGIDIAWTDSGIKEKGINNSNGKVVVKINRDYFRPCEVDLLLGNPEKAKTKLGWIPKVDIKSLSSLMLDADLKRLNNE